MFSEINHLTIYDIAKNSFLTMVKEQDGSQNSRERYQKAQALIAEHLNFNPQDDTRDHYKRGAKSGFAPPPPISAKNLIKGAIFRSAFGAARKFLRKIPFLEILPPNDFTQLRLCPPPLW